MASEVLKPGEGDRRLPLPQTRPHDFLPGCRKSAITGSRRESRRLPLLTSRATRLRPLRMTKATSRLASRHQDSSKPEAWLDNYLSMSYAKWAAAWAAELDRRVRELDAGTVKAIPWEQVRSETLERLRSK
jgi:hypothetical protein